jgi:hypothetical protein
LVHKCPTLCIHLLLLNGTLKIAKRALGLEDVKLTGKLLSTKTAERRC